VTACAMLAVMIAAGVGTFIALKPVEIPSPRVEEIPSRDLVTAAKPPAAVEMPLVIARPARTQMRDLMPLVVSIWICGVIVLALWHAMGWAWLWRLRSGNAIRESQSRLSALQARMKITRIVRLIECV